MGTKTHLFIIENLETGESVDMWMDIQVEYCPGDDVTAPATSTKIANWGTCLEDSQPDWVKYSMLENELKYVDLSDILDEEYD